MTRRVTFAYDAARQSYAREPPLEALGDVSAIRATKNHHCARQVKKYADGVGRDGEAGGPKIGRGGDIDSQRREPTPKPKDAAFQDRCWYQKQGYRLVQ